MCFPIDCWLCMPRTFDDDLAPASRAQPAQQRNGSHYNGNGNGNGGHHYNGNGYYPAHYSSAAAEADRKASNDDARRGPVHGATGAQAKAAYPYAGADDGALKQQPAAAPNGRVAAADGHGARGAPHHYYERAQPPAHREDAAGSYYPAATAAAYRERY